MMSCAIITMPANELLMETHNAKQRMPLILPPEAVDTGRSPSNLCAPASVHLNQGSR